jgi:dimethylaniline monooxygenase (N-oxide forming)
MSSMWWISLIKGEIAQPLSPSHYHLLVKEDARIKYGVDHSAYISTLAKDIGAAPGLWQLWREYGTQVLVCYWYVCPNINARTGTDVDTAALVQP